MARLVVEVAQVVVHEGDEPEVRVRLPHAHLLEARGAQRWPEVPNFAPSAVRRHVKYSSRTFIDARLGTGPTYAVWEKYMDRGSRSSYAGHAGTPGPLGSPFFAKFVQ